MYGHMYVCIYMQHQSHRDYPRPETDASTLKVAKTAPSRTKPSSSLQPY